MRELATLDWMTVGACLVHFALAFLALARGSKSPLAIPLGLLCLDIAGWNGSYILSQLTHRHLWSVVDHALSPLTPPLTLQFVLVFVGRRRELRWTLFIAFIAATCSSVAGIVELAFEAPHTLLGSQVWASWLLAIALPTVAYALFLLARHLFTSSDETERIRTRLLIASFVTGMVMGATDEISTFVPALPSIGALGMIVAALPMAVVALRFRLLDRDVSLRVITLVLALSSAILISYVVVCRELEPEYPLLLVSLLTVLMVALFLGRRWAIKSRVEKQRVSELARLGRFSAQMSHDLKNPLTAMKGAAQVLRHDLIAPESGIDRLAFVDLMLEQIERMTRVADAYGRLAKIDPHLTTVDLNQLVRSVLAMQSLVVPKNVVLDEKLDATLPPQDLDRDMIASVLENLVRNAFEAMPDGGRVTIRTTPRETNGAEGIILTVEDDGVGMDARTRELALEDFFTTKTNGSGLGLAYVRRIAEAHGGGVSIASDRGRGTVVQVSLGRARRSQKLPPT